MSNQQIPVACDMSALPDRDHHETIGTQLLSQTLSVIALDDGYQLEFPIAALSIATEFIDGERRCCPFFQFTIQVKPAASDLQLRITGGEGVKTFLTSELLPLLPGIADVSGQV
jgi:hypothetical protein